MKNMLTFWLDSKYRNKVFYIGKLKNVLDNRLSHMQPHNVVSRLPRSINNLSQWKASEFRSFLLYYAVPCLAGILPLEYMTHFILLQSAIYVLLGSAITQLDMVTAEQRLKKFCENLETLYGPKALTSNVHALGHLVGKVRDLGPLWAHSCFFYEGLNGELRRMFSGSTNVNSQISIAISMQHNLPIMSSKMITNSPELNFYQRMLFRHHDSSKFKLADGMYRLGPEKMCKEISQSIIEAIERALNGRPTGLCFKFFRLIYKHAYYNSVEYCKATRRISFCVKYGHCKYGLVTYFMRVFVNGSYRNVAIIEELLVKDTQEFVWLPIHMRCVGKSNVKAAILVEDIHCPCIYSKLPSQSHAFVTAVPNLCEGD